MVPKSAAIRCLIFFEYILFFNCTNSGRHSTNSLLFIPSPNADEFLEEKKMVYRDEEEDLQTYHPEYAPSAYKGGNDTMI